MKNKNNYMILSVIINIILAILCVLFATDTLNFNSNLTSKNNQTSENLNKTNKNNSNPEEDDDNKSQAQSSSPNSFDSIKGVYKYEQSFYDSLNNTSCSADVMLYLYQNGTYQYMQIAPCLYTDRTFGNYEIHNNNQIILTELYYSGSDTGIYKTTKTDKTTLTFDAINSIKDASKKILDISGQLYQTGITLTKTNEPLNQENSMSYYLEHKQVIEP